MYPYLPFDLFGFKISTFGVMMALAFLGGGRMVASSFERAGQSRDAAWQLVTWAMVGGVVGSKVWFGVEAIARNPGLPIWEPLFSRGGITWYGGLVGGALLVLPPRQASPDDRDERCGAGSGDRTGDRPPRVLPGR
jgi:phosphatidylglycerol:prolipoprotein diacylglycerol transferase